jgi:hypothetical protein
LQEWNGTSDLKLDKALKTKDLMIEEIEDSLQDFMQN